MRQNLNRKKIGQILREKKYEMSQILNKILYNLWSF